MSAKALKFMQQRLEIFDRTQLTANMENILKAVAWKTFDDGPCACGNDALASRAKTSERAVRRCLERAIALHIIHRERACRRAGRGRTFDRLYIIGFNERRSYQTGGVSNISNSKPTGRCEPSNRTLRPDLPDITSGTYKETDPSTSFQPLTLKSRSTECGSAVSGTDIEEFLDGLRDEAPADVFRMIVVDCLIAPLVLRRRWDGPLGGLRLMTNGLVAQKITVDEANAVLSQLLATRKVSVLPSHLEEAVKGRLSLRPKPPVHSGDVDLMKSWQFVLNEIAHHIGQEKILWFSTVVIERIVSGTVYLVTHEPWVAQHIERDFQSQLRASLDFVYGNVVAVHIAARRVAPNGTFLAAAQENARSISQALK